ncbi:ATP-binding protein [Myceligenerans pegani]|uniref:ATP-binding protein n=1 Tax=Myceligenerans pegani TaxID=2776917 RepID=A0ABR9N6D0_9MICO|nr:DUF4143 domain-containing protein [Myceligenerans sp. TRM 65318]MBE1878587.1 ATP-binding protein [Myceligenerans sp. TRM 65318]MBE3020858.1 ATP-binding protein [Myceligenerans sp. TRM 65318]
MTYLPRIVDQQLDDLLEGLPAIALVGPKAVGKTETASRRAKTILDLGDEFELRLAQTDPQRLTRVERPVLVDEWQVHPPIWDTVRRAVDRGAGPGDFLLTGSASPSQKPMHSGAGRIVQLRMRPMSLAERGIAKATVSLAALLSGTRPDISGDSTVGLESYVDEIVASGFPGIRQLAPRFRADALDGYLNAVVDRDFQELGHTVRRPGSLRAWLRAFAAATSTTASYNSILEAATPGDADKPARTTTTTYRELLQRMWLAEEIPAWTGLGSIMTALGVAPKHQLCDPALAARLLNVSGDALLTKANPSAIPLPRNGSLVGALFESLTTQSIQVYADANRARVSHLRTNRGDHEVDLIVERGDGKVVAVEVKLTALPDGNDVKHLRWLQDKLGDDLLDAVVVTSGPAAYRREDGIAVVPLALLGV